MPPDSPPGGDDATSGDGDQHGDEPQVLLFMTSGRKRELLVDTLGDRYVVRTTTDVATLDTEFDCCVFDARTFNRVAGTVQHKRDTAEPVFVPFVLLVDEGEAASMAVEPWNYVDDVIELPVPNEELHARIGNLVKRRRTAAELAECEAQLATTVRDLALKEQAIDEAPVGFTIAEAGGEDNPLVYVNEQFKRETGYGSSVLGDDCRFLQGGGTDPETTARIRAAIDAGEPVQVDVLNYRKDGQTFWNDLRIAPLRDSDGALTHFAGFQTDITDRKIRERRLEVLNRVLSHNLRNQMNVIEGHLGLLGDAYDGDQPPDSLGEIEETAAELVDLAKSVRHVERTLSGSESATMDLFDEMNHLSSSFENRFPDAEFDLSLPDGGPREVAVTGLMTAVEEAVENAVTHNDTATPSVAVRVRRRPDGWLDIEIEDDGPGIPEEQVSVLGRGETPLHHADRLGLWLIYWVVSRAGGTLSVDEATPRGSVLMLSVPIEG
jgi:PAS domain S-box-containing protein